MAVAFPNAIQSLIQQNLLEREINDALRPTQLFRSVAARREPWDAQVGETKIFSRRGLLPVNTRPNTPGKDPSPQSSPSVEQWSVTMFQYTNTLDTNLPSSYVSIQNLFLNDAKKLAIQAGITVSHIVRNKLYTAYLGGNAYVTLGAGASVNIHVNALAGFNTVLNALGQQTPVSAGSPLPITVAGTAANVTGVTPDDANNPAGSGTLILAVALATTTGDAVLALNRSQMLRPNGALTTNGLSVISQLSLATVRTAVNQLRRRNVPTYADGTYHIHLDPDSEGQLFADAEFQRLYTGKPNEVPQKDYALAQFQGVTYYRNNECPFSTNVTPFDFIPGDMAVVSGAAAGMPVHRPILLGDTSLMEVYVPRNGFLDQAADMDPLSQVKGFTMAGDDAVMMTDGIRYMVRPPIDRLQQTVGQTWAIEADWGIPSDSVTGSPDMFKRAVVIEHV